MSASSPSNGHSSQRMDFDAAAFRGLLRHVPMPVAVLTTALDGRRDGLTVSSFTSLSLAPPLISVSLFRETPATTLTLDAGRFAINILAADAGHVSDHFAQHHSVPKFDIPGIEEGPAGLPTLATAVAVLYAQVDAVHDVGDHYLITGEVFAGHDNGGIPLVRYLSHYSEPKAPDDVGP